MDAAGQEAAEEGVGSRASSPACGTAGPDSTFGAGTCCTIRSNSGAMSLCSASSEVARPALLGRGEECREVELLVGGVEGGEQVEDLVVHLVGAASGGRPC